MVLSSHVGGGNEGLKVSYDDGRPVREPSFGKKRKSFSSVMAATLEGDGDDAQGSNPHSIIFSFVLNCGLLIGLDLDDTIRGVEVSFRVYCSQFFLGLWEEREDVLEAQNFDLMGGLQILV